MAATYTPIATTTLTTSTATVSFSSISSSYTDLILVANIAQVSGANSIRYRFNDDSNTNYSVTWLQGNGSSASSSRESSITSAFIQTTGDTSLQTVYMINVFNYANATTYKTSIGRGNNAGNATDASVSLWRKTPEAINKITLAMGSSFPTNNFAAGSTFTLYGVLNA